MSVGSADLLGGALDSPAGGVNASILFGAANAAEFADIAGCAAIDFTFSYDTDLPRFAVDVVTQVFGADPVFTDFSSRASDDCARSDALGASRPAELVASAL